MTQRARGFFGTTCLPRHKHNILYLYIKEGPLFKCIVTQ